MGRASLGSEFSGKNTGHRPVSLPGMFAQGVFSRILLVETDYQVSLYISNFTFYFVYNSIVSFSFHRNFNIFLRNI